MKKITVIDSTVVKRGTSEAGKEWALREIVAVDENGAPIEEKLKSFDDLQGAVEVEVERVEHEKFGTSFMLKLPRSPSPGARLGPKVDDIRGRVEMLEKRVDQLVAVVGQMRSGVPNGAPVELPSSAVF